MGKTLLSRLGNFVSAWGASAILACGLGGCKREKLVQIQAPNQIEQTSQAQQTQTSQDKFSNCTYQLGISWSWDTGIDLILYGEPFDRENPEKLALQLSSLEEKIQEYEKFRQDLIKSNRTNIDFPVFTLDSLTNPAVIARQDKEKIWNGLNRTPLRNTNYLNYSNLKIAPIFYRHDCSQIIKILNESERQPVLLFFYTGEGQFIEEDKCREQFTRIIDKLFSETNSFQGFKLQYSKENCDFFDLNPTQSKLIMLNKGVRKIIYARGQLDTKSNLGREYKDSEVLEIIRKLAVL